MNPIIRNLVHVLRRFKLAAFLNILGLSVAFAAFMIIMIHLNFHFGFDRFHKDYDKIFRLEISFEGQSGVLFSRPLAEAFIASSPHIITGARSASWPGDGNTHFSVERNGVQRFFQESLLRVTPEFTDVFTFDFVEGSGDALNTFGNVIIPLSISQRLFGNESAIGRHLTLSNGIVYTVGGVYRDFPNNSILRNDILTSFPEGLNRDNWFNVSYHVYIRINDASNVPVIIENFQRMFIDGAIEVPEWMSDLGTFLILRALPDIHFSADSAHDTAPKANRQALLILLAIGIAIMVIAAINFTNFSTALAPMRIRNINTQRVLGAQQRTIRWILVIEAMVFAVVSYGVAVLLVKLVGDTQLADFVSGDLLLSANTSVVLWTILIAIAVGIAAGLYPSRYMTSFAPAMALKGNAALSPKGKKLRNTLIGIQFMASFILIIGASFMYLQNRAMQNAPVGFDKNILITANTGMISHHRDAYTHQLMQHAGIETITHGESLLLSGDSFMHWGRMYQGESISFQVIPVQYNFLQVMGIDITAGRDFRREDANSELGVFIFNETARQSFNLELNTSIDGWDGDDSPARGDIIGFMPDIKFVSHRLEMQPMALYVWGTRNWGNRSHQAYIRLSSGANVRDAMAHIRSTLSEFDPNFPFEVRFFDEILQQLYENEIRLSWLITLFSLIAIFISIVGVFGLVVFDSECRRKEIGIRKVHGATTMEVITMFNKAYIKILLICFVIAVPIAWIAVNRWLENFAYRTPMYWWVFVLAFLAVATIMVLTVTIQNWRVANEDPVKLVKTE